MSQAKTVLRPWSSPPSPDKERDMFVAYSDKHLPHEPKQIIFSGRIFDSVEVPARATELAASPR